MRDPFFGDLIAKQDAGVRSGIASVCSAHPIVLEAALKLGLESAKPVLIEATCNQVNQDGGYTGMRPNDFRAFVHDLADRVGYDRQNLILGGDHLGPNPWKNLPASEAMAKAQAMVANYVEAGFSKIHLDASMSCADDPLPLSTQTIAARAAKLAVTAERQADGRVLSYIIGTEVPVPGGATEHVDALTPTTPSDATETVEVHRRAFAALGIEAAFERVIGLVVQPGVEFGHENVVAYDPSAAKNLSDIRKNLGLVFEAHSTDYQSPAALADLVRDGFAILKVGPWLTFALREALYRLDLISLEMFGRAGLKEGMEALMLEHPDNWQRYYFGGPAQERLQRHFSYSDRIRYYWTTPPARRLVDDLMSRFGSHTIPDTLVSQYLPGAWRDVVDGHIKARPHDLLLHAVTDVLREYQKATQQS